MDRFSLRGLQAATHAPLHPDGSLNLAAVERQCAHLLERGVPAVFVNGSTGEGHSLTAGERRQVAERWSDVVRGTSLRVVVHVGANSLADAAGLAAHAAAGGAAAVAMLAPSYYRPASLADLVACCAQVAAAAPALPFYFYDIPALTGVSLPMEEFLLVAPERIPNFAGIKFTNPDGMMFQQCLHHRGPGGEAFSILWGTDECLLAGLALGATGAVGSTYNFAAPLYQAIMRAFAAGDVAAAQRLQLLSAQMVLKVIGGYRALPSLKSMMGFAGVECGPPRLPQVALTPAERAALHADLAELGFLAWLT